MSIDNTSSSGDDLGIFDDQSPYSAISIYEDSTGHSIEITGDNLFNPDTAIHLDFSASDEDNNYIVIDGGTGASTALIFNSNGGQDYGASFNLGNGNDVGVYVFGGAGTDVGLLINAETAADLTGNIIITPWRS